MVVRFVIAADRGRRRVVGLDENQGAQIKVTAWGFVRVDNVNGSGARLSPRSSS
jgi:hypothetical protein